MMVWSVDMVVVNEHVMMGSYTSEVKRLWELQEENICSGPTE